MFDAKIDNSHDFRKFVLNAEYFVVGYEPEPVKSYHDELYTRCWVEYPYLRDWAFKDVFQQGNISNNFSWDISKGLNFVAEIDDGIRLRITIFNGRMSCEVALVSSITKIFSFFSKSIAGSLSGNLNGILYNYFLF